jgi:hypothetical protein
MLVFSGVHSSTGMLALAVHMPVLLLLKPLRVLGNTADMVLVFAAQSMIWSAFAYLVFALVCRLRRPVSPRQTPSGHVVSREEGIEKP